MSEGDADVFSKCVHGCCRAALIAVLQQLGVIYVCQLEQIEYICSGAVYCRNSALHVTGSSE